MIKISICSALIENHWTDSYEKQLPMANAGKLQVSNENENWHDGIKISAAMKFE